MANKDRNKRSARQARAAERAQREAAQAASGNGPSAAKAGDSDQAKAKTTNAVAKTRSGKPAKRGPFQKLRAYFDDVRVEMHRVVWPSKAELKSYSVATIVMLVVVGLVVWLVDSGIVALLVGYTGLRG